MCERSYETFDWCSSGINLELNWHLFVQKRAGIESRGERRARRGMRGDVERECAKAEPSALDAGEAGMCMRRAVRQGRGWKPGRGRTQRAPALRKGCPGAMCPGRERIAPGRSPAGKKSSPAEARRRRPPRGDACARVGQSKRGFADFHVAGAAARPRSAAGIEIGSRTATSRKAVPHQVKTPAKGGGRTRERTRGDCQHAPPPPRAASRRASGTTRRAPLGAPRATRRAFAALRATSH